MDTTTSLPFNVKGKKLYMYLKKKDGTVSIKCKTEEGYDYYLMEFHDNGKVVPVKYVHDGGVKFNLDKDGAVITEETKVIEEKSHKIVIV